MEIPFRIELFLHATDEDSCDISINVYFNNKRVFSKRLYMKQNTQTNIKYKVEISYHHLILYHNKEKDIV